MFKKWHHIFIIGLIFLSGCGGYATQKNRLGITAKQLRQGTIRFMALSDPHLDIEQIKNIFGENFDEKSERFNKKTQCKEYEVYPYGVQSLTVTIGIDKDGKYVYFVDTGGIKNPQPARIVKVSTLSTNSDQ